MTKYLVTGGCGYIGSHLVNQLLSDGHTVRVLDNMARDQVSNLREDCEFVAWDTSDLETLESAFSGIEGCFHLAGTERLVCKAKPYSLESRVSVDPLKLFGVACSPSQSRPVPIVYASTGDVYGDNADLFLSENARTRPFTQEAVERLSTELYARVFAISHHLPSTGLRLFDVYGPANGSTEIENNLVVDLVNRVICKQPIYVSGNAVETFDLVHVDDVCRFFVQAMEKVEGKASVFNVCSGKPVSLLELVDAISALCNTKAKICISNTKSCRIHTSIGNPENTAHKLGVRVTTDLPAGLRTVIDSFTRGYTQISPALTKSNGLLQMAYKGV